MRCLDCSGDGRFRKVCREFYEEADVVCIVYDVTSIDSFENAKKWLESFIAKVKKTKEDRVNKILYYIIGNKCDVDSEERIV